VTGFIKYAVPLIATLAISAYRPAECASRASPLPQSFDLEVPWQPTVVNIGGTKTLAYELHITNFYREALILERLEVLNPASGSIVHTYQASELRGLIGRWDRPEPEDRLAIPSGVHAIVYLNLPLKGRDSDLSAVTHRVEFDLPSAVSGHGVVEGGAFKADADGMPSLGPPLRGGPWAAIYDASWERGHRRVIYSVEGRAHIPGRFAIDWFRVEPSGKAFEGTEKKPSDWYGYGAEVLAVADCLVASAKDGISERSAVSNSAEAIPFDSASGNYVSLDLGAGRYAFYEHLIPGTITVKTGDRVRLGQVLGRLGYSGESTGPHLHFHVSDRDSPLNAEGLPYTLRAFALMGAYASAEDFDGARPWVPRAAAVRADRGAEFPLPLSVVKFP
jgi:murein DD-endopeptidase